MVIGGKVSSGKFRGWELTFACIHDTSHGSTEQSKLAKAPPSAALHWTSVCSPLLSPFLRAIQLHRGLQSPGWGALLIDTSSMHPSSQRYSQVWMRRR